MNTPHMPQSDRPQSYPRRILLAVTGLSPQIVTETLYALAVAREPAWVPTEIQVLTTVRGADNARLNLLSEQPGWFHRLRREYGLPQIAFGPENIHIMRRADGSALDDIRDEADNIAVADFITEHVRMLSADENASLHVSIAGGRKTMGFYIGYALSLFGRAQDRLSHVLVSSPFESHTEFFYPSPATRVLHTQSQTLDAKNAKVWLGNIPYQNVEPRHWLSSPITTHMTRAWNRNARLPNSLRFKIRLDPNDPKNLVGVIFHVACLPPPEFQPKPAAVVATWQSVYALPGRALSATTR